MTKNAEPQRPREVCDACGFDSDLYDRADTVSSQRVLPSVLNAAIEELDGEALATRPNDQTWSMIEYIDHVREVVFGNRFAIETALADPGSDLGEPPDMGLAPEQPKIDLATATEGVANEYEAMRQLLRGLDDDQWRLGVTVGGRHRPVGWFARHVLHDGLHHLADIGRIRHGFGLGAASGTGALSGIHVSNGGVPKRPLESVSIAPSGVDGDNQSDRKHHGRPVQAVSLWSSDVIAGLQDDGHPIYPGAAGENITVDGIDWPSLRPGSRIDIGSVPMLISAHAIPCAKNAQWFSDRDFNRILHERHPGSSRLYAIPLASGEVTVGDSVVVEPSND